MGDVITTSFGAEARITPWSKPDTNGPRSDMSYSSAVVDVVPEDHSDIIALTRRALYDGNSGFFNAIACLRDHPDVRDLKSQPIYHLMLAIHCDNHSAVEKILKANANNVRDFDRPYYWRHSVDDPVCFVRPIDLVKSMPMTRLLRSYGLQAKMPVTAPFLTL